MAVLLTVVNGAALGLTSGLAQAVPLETGGVTISAVVTPVRYILVDKHNVIQQVLSNSPEAVTPIVYKYSFTSVPIPLTAAIDTQYEAIMAHTNVHHTGLIYASTTDSPKSLTNWLRLSAHESLVAEKFRIGSL